MDFENEYKITLFMILLSLYSLNIQPVADLSEVSCPILAPNTRDRKTDIRQRIKLASNQPVYVIKMLIIKDLFCLPLMFLQSKNRYFLFDWRISSCCRVFARSCCWKALNETIYCTVMHIAQYSTVLYTVCT